MDGPDYIYYNVEIPYNENTVIAKGSPASFNAFLNTPIIDVPSDYKMAVARFSVPGSLIPIFVAEIEPGQSNPNLMPYHVTLSYSGNDYVAQLIYVPQNTLAVPSGPPFPKSPYYYVYYYQQMIDIVNTALSTAFTALKAAHGAVTSTEAPFLIFNPNTQRISIIVPATYIADTIPIYMQASLVHMFFEGINSIFRGINTVNYKDYEIIVQNTEINGFGKPGVGVGNPPLYWEMKQEFVSLQYWNTFKNLTFITSSMPINSEFSQVAGSTPSQRSSLPIITDFEPILDTAGASRTIFQFFPQGPYRFISLTSPNPLSIIDISVYWRDINNNLYLLEVPCGQNLTIKLAFINKNNVT